MVSPSTKRRMRKSYEDWYANRVWRQLEQDVLRLEGRERNRLIKLLTAGLRTLRDAKDNPLRPRG